MTDDTPHDSIAAQDELLELLYWLEGEGFEGNASMDAIVRFIAKPKELVRQTLVRLESLGSLRCDAASGEYRLTETGRGEAARRFAEEFAPMLSQGHGECSDPNCDCHSNPAGAAECHARATHEGHRH